VTLFSLILSYILLLTSDLFKIFHNKLYLILILGENMISHSHSPINNNNNNNNNNNINSNNNSNINSNINSTADENAEKVNKFIRDLFPERFPSNNNNNNNINNNHKHGSKSKSNKKHQVQHHKDHLQQQYGLGVIPASHNNNHHHHSVLSSQRSDLNDQLQHQLQLQLQPTQDIEETMRDNNNNNNILTSLDQQLKLLKQQLKLKDDRILKLFDHSQLLTNQNERFKGEIALQQQRIVALEQENQIKENRINEISKNLKKTKKMLKESDHPSRKNIGMNMSPTTNQSSSTTNELMYNLSYYESEIIRLKNRETALMDAVEELSNQNEDLILKLKESMQRELDLR
jgi:hypothetical protein